MSYKQISYPIQISDRNKRIASIKIRLVLYNCSGTAYFTDLLLQAGTTTTGWVGNVSEFKWALNG